MRPMTLTKGLLILSAFGLSGATCNRVAIYDHELCGDKGELGARCFNLLSDGNRTIDFDTWAEERFGQICMKPDAFANFKGALLKLCNSSGRCTWQEKQDIKNLGKKLQAFNREIEAMR